MTGKVQGVCFRAYTEKAAQEMDVTGWVRNRSDGRVEGEAWGKEEDIKRFSSWLHKGSPHGRVGEVDLNDLGPFDQRPAAFEIRFG